MSATKKRILHIDDNEKIRFLVGEVLKLNGYEYLGVSNAEEGLKVIQTNNLSLLILDLKLAGKMQGVDLLKKIKKKGIKIKVIVLTASPKSIKNKLKTNYPELIVECIFKPFKPIDLVAEIKKVLK